MDGMGIVYVCLDHEENRPVALKTFKPKYLPDRAARDRFLREGTTWVNLGRHPHIVRCFYMDILDNRPFMFLEWIAGEQGKGADLRGWLRRGPLDLRLALDFTIDICRGLIHAEEKQPGLVHRDLKPGNILVAQGPLAKITDFGLAQIVQSAELEISQVESGVAGRQSLMGQGGIVGTPAYMAPEQWRGEALDARTDIYALGCILYEMLTGSWPFQATTLSGLRRQHLAGKIPKASESNPLLGEVDRLLGACLAKQREERFSSVDELSQQLALIYQQRFTEPPRAITNSSEFSPRDYLNRGVTYENLQRHDEALVDYSRAIQLAPDYARAYNNRGKVNNDLQRYAEAFADLTRAIELDPDFAPSYNNRGVAYLGLQRNDEALASFSRAIEIDPLYAKAYGNRGAAYNCLGRYQEALADCSRAIEIDPSLAEAYCNRGSIFVSLQRYDEALADYAYAIEIDPNLVKAYLGRGLVYAGIQRYEEAIANYTRAIELEPVDGQAYFNRGLVYDSLQDSDRAAQDYTRAIELDPTFAAAYHARGLIYAEEQFYDRALADYACVVELKPNNAKVYMDRGKIHHVVQNYREALADYSIAIELNPTAEAYTSRGACYDDLQLYQEALMDHTRSLELNPDLAISYLNRGNTFGNLGRFDQALADQTRCIELDPTLAQAYYNRGVTYEYMQGYERALADFDHAIELDDSLADAYFKRGNVRKALGQLREAFDDYVRVTQLEPDYVDPYFNIGILLFETDRLQEALGFFEKAAKLGDLEAAQCAAQVRKRLETVKRFRCTNPECTFDGTIAGIHPQSPVARCPLCRTMAVRVDEDRPTFRCSSCGQVFQIRGRAPTLIQCPHCGGQAQLIG